MSSQPSSSGDHLTSEAVIAATAKPILEYGRSWMMDPATAERGAELGLTPGFGFWVNGRAGFLGPVDSDVAAAAIGFMSPEQIRSLWGVGIDETAMPDMTAAYAEMAGRFGTRTLAAIDGDELRRLADLCHKVADAAGPSSGVLFTGWRLLDRPADPGADAAVAMNVLRELRGGAHLSAVNAVGLGPHGAIMSTDDPIRGGASWAEVFGWTAPHPEPDFALRAEAETVTDKICCAGYDALDQTERADLVRLVGAARAALDA